MKRLGFALLIICIAILAFTFYRISPLYNQTQQFSGYTLLSSSWEKYKEKFINADGRVLDFSQESITTSEGQSYAMLRAVWSDDKETFDKVWKWTKENMKRPDDALFTWRWGKLDDGTYGPLKNGGENAASDADTDIALALIFAAHRWNQEAYQDQAKVIIADIWDVETDVANGKRYMIAGNWATDDQRIVVNPSYFAPYAWKIFAQVDDNDWNSLVTPSYALLKQSGREKLDSDKGVGLAPDWVAVDKKTGALSATNLPNLTTNYSFDAVRTPWRITLDYMWNKDPQAKEYLESLSVLDDLYQKDGKLYASYEHNGTPIQTFESPTAYSTALGYFIVENPEVAEEIYQNKILKLYSNDQNTFKDDIGYYEQNWLWFGAALYNKQLIPYTK
ncbi:MAG: glycosyl hydrolase [Candidatus Levybacteria bacterium]|nr:glycosyl hydrolase [Candidatus Levybacteria bacterium]